MRGFTGASGLQEWRNVENRRQRTARQKHAELSRFQQVSRLLPGPSMAHLCKGMKEPKNTPRYCQLQFRYLKWPLKSSNVHGFEIKPQQESVNSFEKYMWSHHTGLGFLQDFRGVNPLRRVSFLPFENFEFSEMMLSKFLQFSKEQLLETSES